MLASLLQIRKHPLKKRERDAVPYFCDIIICRISTEAKALLLHPGRFSQNWLFLKNWQAGRPLAAWPERSAQLVAQAGVLWLTGRAGQPAGLPEEFLQKVGFDLRYLGSKYPFLRKKTNPKTKPKTNKSNNNKNHLKAVAV